MDSMTSIWMARLDRDVNSTAQRLALESPPLVGRAQTCHGPNISSPT